MHIILKRAAVAIGSEVNVPSDESTFASNPPPATAIKTLWASKPLPTHAGRVVAVRINSRVVEVGIIEDGANTLRWKSAAAVMSGAQERKWLREAKFTSQ